MSWVFAAGQALVLNPPQNGFGIPRTIFTCSGRWVRSCRSVGPARMAFLSELFFQKNTTQPGSTVDERNPAPVEVGSLSRVVVWGLWTINSISTSKTRTVQLDIFWLSLPLSNPGPIKNKNHADPPLFWWQIFRDKDKIREVMSCDPSEKRRANTAYYYTLFWAAQGEELKTSNAEFLLLYILVTYIQIQPAFWTTEFGVLLPRPWVIIIMFQYDLNKITSGERTKYLLQTFEAFAVDVFSELAPVWWDMFPDFLVPYGVYWIPSLPLVPIQWTHLLQGRGAEDGVGQGRFEIGAGGKVSTPPPEN